MKSTTQQKLNMNFAYKDKQQKEFEESFNKAISRALEYTDIWNSYLAHDKELPHEVLNSLDFDKQLKYRELHNESRYIMHKDESIQPQPESAVGNVKPTLVETNIGADLVWAVVLAFGIIGLLFLVK